MIDHASTRVGKAQRVEQRELKRFRDLDRESSRAVDHPRVESLEVFEVVQRVEDSLSVIAQVSGRAHAVEKQRQAGIGFGRIVLMFVRANRRVRQVPPLQLGEEKAKPVWMLVVDAYRF